MMSVWNYIKQRKLNTNGCVTLLDRRKTFPLMELFSKRFGHNLWEQNCYQVNVTYTGPTDPTE